MTGSRIACGLLRDGCVVTQSDYSVLHALLSPASLAIFLHDSIVVMCAIGRAGMREWKNVRGQYQIEWCNQSQPCVHLASSLTLVPS